MIEKVNVSKTKREKTKVRDSNAAHENEATKECDYCGYKHWPGIEPIIVRHGANNAHFVKPQIISVRNAGRNVTQYVRSVDHQNADMK